MTMTTTADNSDAGKKNAPVIRDWQGKVLRPGTQKYNRALEHLEAIQRLKDMGVKPGTVIYTRMNHVSRSGMYRAISVHVVVKGELVDITYWANKVMDYGIDRNHGGLKVGGCGMDMGFSVVYNLSSSMYRKGFRCIGEKKRCPSNDHSNGDRNYKPHWHNSGGYALVHRWM